MTAVRQVGLWLAVDVDPAAASARTVCARLADRGVLCKDTHEMTVRIAPPLTTTAEELAWAMDRIEAVLGELAPSMP